MGLYLNRLTTGRPLPVHGKADALLADGAVEQVHPHYEPFVVCVVVNPTFDAAGFCFSRHEFVHFFQGVGERPARWLVAEAACRANFQPDTLAIHLADVAAAPAAKALAAFFE